LHELSAKWLSLNQPICSSSPKPSTPLPCSNPNPNPSIDCEKDPTNEACASLNKVDQAKEATLIMWGLFDDSTAFQSIIKEFNKQFPNVKVTYVKKQFAESSFKNYFLKR